VLLSTDFAYIQHQISALGGQNAGDTSATSHAQARSLYPFAFGVDEAGGILNRLLQAQQPASLQAN
jgi:hypothetical protein